MNTTTSIGTEYLDLNPSASAADRLVEYVFDIPFQVVLTIAGLGRYSIGSLKRFEKRLVDCYEKAFRLPLSYVVSYERTELGYWNLHAAFACHRRIDISFMESVLRGWKVDFKIEPMVIEKKAKWLRYLFKEVAWNRDYDFDLVRLNYYLKEPQLSRDRRRQRRAAERNQALMGVKHLPGPIEGQLRPISTLISPGSRGKGYEGGMSETNGENAKHPVNGDVDAAIDLMERMVDCHLTDGERGFLASCCDNICQRKRLKPSQFESIQAIWRRTEAEGLNEGRILV